MKRLRPTAQRATTLESCKLTSKQQGILDAIAAWASNYPCINTIHVFGSVARNEAHHASDLDIAFEYVPELNSDDAMVECYTKVNTDWENLAASLKEKFGHQPTQTGLSPFACPYDEVAWRAIRDG